MFNTFDDAGSEVSARLHAALQEAVLAYSGASGCLLFLDAGSQTLHLCRGPGCNAVLGTLVHGMASQAALASFLFDAGALVCLD